MNIPNDFHVIEQILSRLFELFLGEIGTASSHIAKRPVFQTGIFKIHMSDGLVDKEPYEHRTICGSIPFVRKVPICTDMI
jgi:hypothetical protein